MREPTYYCIENDLPRQQELEAIRQAKIHKEKEESLQQARKIQGNSMCGTKQVVRCWECEKNLFELLSE